MSSQSFGRVCEDIEDSPAQIHLRGHTVLRGAGEPHAQLLEDWACTAMPLPVLFSPPSSSALTSFSGHRMAAVAPAIPSISHYVQSWRKRCFLCVF